jgi:CAAX amino terminal protease family.
LNHCVAVFAKNIDHDTSTDVGYKANTNILILLAVLLLALAPRPLGQLAVIALLPVFRRKVTWLCLSPRYLGLSLVTYLAAFSLDYLFVGVPQFSPPWWEAVALTPLAEEFAFRALPFALLPPPLAWLFAVVVFGFLHPANPFVASLYGASLAFMYRGGGYLAAVALHAFNNALWLALAAGLL